MCTRWHGAASGACVAALGASSCVSPTLPRWDNARARSLDTEILEGPSRARRSNAALLTCYGRQMFGHGARWCSSRTESGTKAMGRRSSRTEMLGVQRVKKGKLKGRPGRLEGNAGQRVKYDRKKSVEKGREVEDGREDARSKRVAVVEGKNLE
ncbi:hypothetical protein L209DRAFT_132670 [Thermothelomyces heterothallicus CBS 203.75]